MFYDDVEPKVLISMPVVEDLAPQTQSHAGRQERVKVELSHSVLPILCLDLLSSKRNPFKVSCNRTVLDKKETR